MSIATALMGLGVAARNASAQTQSAAKPTYKREISAKLIYSYDIKVPGKSGIEEVNVSAVDGSVIGVEHESPDKEKKEAAAEKNAKKP